MKLSPLKKLAMPPETRAYISASLKERYPQNTDPWGLDINKSLKLLEFVYPLYRHYFKVRIFGSEHIENTPYVVISNHSGQIAIDGMLIATAFIVDIKPPQILRAMVERFFTSLPFINKWASEGGAVLGDRQNCHHLLNRGHSVLVFPEGVNGITKNSSEFYKPQKFTKGFIRMAIYARTPILPIAVVGAEEFYPYVYHPRKLANFLGLPGLPLTPNFIPLPSPVDIYIGKPYYLPDYLTTDASDKFLDEHISYLEKTVQDMIQTGLKKRRPFFANSKESYGK